MPRVAIPFSQEFAHYPGIKELVERQIKHDLEIMKSDVDALNQWYFNEKQRIRDEMDNPKYKPRGLHLYFKQQKHVATGYPYAYIQWRNGPISANNKHARQIRLDRGGPGYVSFAVHRCDPNGPYTFRNLHQFGHKDQKWEALLALEIEKKLKGHRDYLQDLGRFYTAISRWRRLQVVGVPRSLSATQISGKAVRAFERLHDEGEYADYFE